MPQRAILESQPYPPPVVFGQFLLLQRIAVGGMAELFVAKDRKRLTLCVVKRILPHLAQEVDFIQMFLDEARIAAQLRHENIVEIFELGKLDDTFFMSMEYLDGVDLKRLLRTEIRRHRAIPPHIAAHMASKIAAGLSCAHHQLGLDGKPMEVIHRDVTPQNVMVTTDGRVKLVDFGIAKAGALVERSRPGVFKGKLQYLSPEQVSEEKVDRRSDLFALGVTLYECTTGKHPFQKNSPEAVMFSIRTEDPPAPHTARRDYPKGLSDIVMKCLAKDPDQRYQEASEVQQALEEFVLLHKPTTDHHLRDYLGTQMATIPRLRPDVLLQRALSAEEPSDVTEKSNVGRRSVAVVPDIPMPASEPQASNEQALESLSDTGVAENEVPEPASESDGSLRIVRPRTQTPPHARRHIRVRVVPKIAWTVAGGATLLTLAGLMYLWWGPRQAALETPAAPTEVAAAAAPEAGVPESPVRSPETAQGQPPALVGGRHVVPSSVISSSGMDAEKRKGKAMAMGRVMFKAPPGTTIQFLSKTWRANTAYRIPAGTLKVHYLCRGSQMPRALSERIPKSNEISYVTLPCR